jgi:hypothetical protein
MHGKRAYGGVEVQVHAFFTSALGGNEWSGSHPKKESLVPIEQEHRRAQDVV